MNISTVNELIQSLESAGELSIREQKFLKLAKAFNQLAAENVALSKDAQRYRFIRERDMFGSDNESGLLSWEELAELECNEFDDALDARINHPNTGFIELDAKLQARKTHATDRFVDGIKADAITASLDACSDYLETDCVMDRLDISYEEAEKRTSGAIEFHDAMVNFANQMREGVK